MALEWINSSFPGKKSMFWETQYKNCYFLILCVEQKVTLLSSQERKTRKLKKKKSMKTEKRSYRANVCPNSGRGITSENCKQNEQNWRQGLWNAHVVTPAQAVYKLPRSELLVDVRSETCRNLRRTSGWRSKNTALMVQAGQDQQETPSL